MSRPQLLQELWDAIEGIFLDQLIGKSFTSADVVMLLKEQESDLWSNAAKKYNEGGKGAGSHKSIRTYVGQYLHKIAENNKGGSFEGYVESRRWMNWGNRSIASFSYDPNATGVESYRNDIEIDLAELLSKQAGGKDVLSLVKCRIGQGPFRRDLITLWKGECAVTGCNHVEILRASHIKPWKDCSNSEKTNPYNGLLLVPHLDTLFDKGLMTFDSKGMVRFSAKLSDETWGILGLRDDWRINLKKEHKIFLAYHRKEVFQKN